MVGMNTLGQCGGRMITIPKSLAEIAADAIRKRIIEGSLELGEQIKESELAESMGLSKTPVREALLQLEAEHLVTILARKGTFVFTISAEDLENLCRVRIVLEQEAMREAYVRNSARLIKELGKYIASGESFQQSEYFDMNYYLKLDYNFHRAIAHNTGNIYLIDALSRIANKVQALRYRSYYSKFFVKRSLTDHEHLYTLLKDDTVDKACEFMQLHVYRIASPEIIAKFIK